MDHDISPNKVEPGFIEAGEGLKAAATRAEQSVKAQGDLSAGGLAQKVGDGLSAVGADGIPAAIGMGSFQELDKMFLDWLNPKRAELPGQAAHLAAVYTDIGEGLRDLRLAVRDIEWGLAEELDRLPIYQTLQSYVKDPGGANGNGGTGNGGANANGNGAANANGNGGAGGDR
ncbi:hypothetical protein D5H75_24170 [Bailinhaonella thermotolerans]|uniref:Uncharacterized protein n=1 Tax=Bailinhaonella thermotolerans TaxID=1070861 RepID=A0A3A4B7G3_9ACTN|nr:hypothetical protein D5H75_24170 [Bailinhaonella thermotolerans]